MTQIRKRLDRSPFLRVHDKLIVTQKHGRAAVPHEFCHCSDVRPGGNQLRCKGVAEVIGADAASDSGMMEGVPPGVFDVAHRLTVVMDEVGYAPLLIFFFPYCKNG